MRQELCWIIGLGCVVLSGCHSRQVESTQGVERLSTAKLLRTPVSSLHPKTTYRSSSARIRLPHVAQIQLQMRGKGGQLKRYFFVREPKSWWVVRLRADETATGHFMKLGPVKKLLNSFGGLKPAEMSNDLTPPESPIQLFLFSKGRRFLLRLMKTPRDKGLGAIYRGEWLLYHQGQLFQQGPTGPLTASVGKLTRALRRLERERGWIQLPMNSSSLEPKIARSIARQLQEKRLKLKRCFKKRRFPASIGALKMSLRFTGDGKLERLRIESKPHKKHAVVWCVWWFVKRWKLEPVAVPSVEYRLSIPPGGP